MSPLPGTCGRHGGDEDFVVLGEPGQDGQWFVFRRCGLESWEDAERALAGSWWDRP
ncbi:hypothetical protein PV392_25765 [Streptomyces sp. ME03-5709C]|nr:hypothetical protein [Streptomyces sp. ME03-5709C]